MPSFLPPNLLSTLRQVIDAPRRLCAWQMRRNISRSPGKEIRVGFGEVLDHDGVIHGGAVKLLPLREAMGGNNPDLFNVLYLVSSAQPEFALDLVRRCRSKGIRFVWNQNGVGYPGWAGSSAELHNAPMRSLRRRADYVIYQSDFCRTCADEFLGPSSVPGEVLFNPVDLQKFRPPEQSLPLAPLRLLTLGTHGYADRVLSTIQCLSAVREKGIDATLTIAGRFQWPDAERQVNQEIQRLRLSDFVKVLPAFSQDEAGQLYRAHHIVLHPKYLDPCPTVVCEALASGCPIVGSASGGVPELVDSTCSYLVPAPVVWDRLITPSGEELAHGVLTLLPRLDEASLAARVRAQTAFDSREWVQRHREIFTPLIG
jgi:glycosyltransferase involved in cell wall biosynthesis